LINYFVVSTRWKNKVRKLEKSLERYKTEAEKIFDQTEILKSNQTGYTAQFENKNQECQTLRVNWCLNLIKTLLCLFGFYLLGHKCQSGREEQFARYGSHSLEKFKRRAKNAKQYS